MVLIHNQLDWQSQERNFWPARAPGRARAWPGPGRGPGRRPAPGPPSLREVPGPTAVGRANLNLQAAATGLRVTGSLSLSLTPTQ